MTKIDRRSFVKGAAIGAIAAPWPHQHWRKSGSKWPSWQHGAVTSQV